MSISKTDYPADQSISPRYLRFEKDSGTTIIIIDDVDMYYNVDVHTEVDRDVAWIKVVTDFGTTLLDDAPGNITALDPAYGDWDKIRLFLHAQEIFVVKYTSTARTAQSQVVGYEFESEDIVYVKIDRQANTVTLYKPA